MGFICGLHRQVASLEAALEGCAAGMWLSSNIPVLEMSVEHDPALVREILKKGLINQWPKEGGFYSQMKE